MFRMISIVVTSFVAVTVVGCGSASDVHMSDKDLEKGKVVVNAYFYDTDPIEVARAAELSRYSFEVSLAMKELREKGTPEAEETLTALLAARPPEPQRVDVPGTISNFVGEARVCHVFLLDRQGRMDPHAAPVAVVSLPPATAPNITPSTTAVTLAEGNRYHFRFINPATGVVVYEQSMLRPVNRTRGWSACVKMGGTIP